MLGYSPWYFETIRKIIVGFGNIFKDIKIVREKDNISQVISVPIMFGNRNRWYAILKEQNQENYAWRNILPAMSYDLVNLRYDPKRQIVPIKNITGNNISIDVKKVVSQMVAVPYEYNFTLSVLTKNMADCLQIMETILCWFTPDFVINIQDIPELGISRNIPVILTGNNFENIYEGDFASKELRVVNFTANFTVNGYINKPLNNSKIILDAITNIRNYNTGELEVKGESLVLTDSNGYILDSNGNNIIRETINEYTYS